MALLMPTRMRPAVALTLIVWALIGPALFAQPQPTALEANIKAVFLFNFSKYVTWPPIVIGQRSPT